jgi:hypothetical protein
MLSANKRNFPVYSVWCTHIDHHECPEITCNLNQNIPIYGHIQ